MLIQDLFNFSRGLHFQPFAPWRRHMFETTSRWCNWRCIAGLTTSLRRNSPRVQFVQAVRITDGLLLSPLCFIVCGRTGEGSRFCSLSLAAQRFLFRDSSACDWAGCYKCKKWAVRGRETFCPFVLTSSLILTSHTSFQCLTFRISWCSPLSSLLISTVHINWLSQLRT